MKNSNFNCDIKDLLYFDHLIMPRVLTFIYWIVIAIVILTGFSTMFTISFFSGLIAIITGLIFTRIIFELIIVIFSINQNLEKLVSLQTNSTKKIDRAPKPVKKPKKPARKTPESA